MILDHVRFSAPFLDSRITGEAWSLAAVFENDEDVVVHKLTKEEFDQVVQLPEVNPLGLVRQLTERVTELQAALDNRARAANPTAAARTPEVRDHPDMNTAINRGATAEALWQLLDDIDTLSDQLKPVNIAAYTRFYERAMDIAKRRHLLLKSDGYKLTWPSGDSVEQGGHPRAPVVLGKYRDLAEAVECAVGGYAWSVSFPEHAALVRSVGELFDRAHVATQPPVPMLLHCPMCNARHIDEGEFATKPHHSHACQSHVVENGKRHRCGHVWRPAIVATVGVEALPGFVNPEDDFVEGVKLVGKRARCIANNIEGTIAQFDQDDNKYHLRGEFAGRLRLLRHEFTVLE